MAGKTETSFRDLQWGERKGGLFSLSGLDQSQDKSFKYTEPYIIIIRFATTETWSTRIPIIRYSFKRNRHQTFDERAGFMSIFNKNSA